MTEKKLISTLLPPQTLGMGSIGKNSTSSRTISTQTNNKDIFCTGTTYMHGSRIFLSGRGGGSRLLNLFYSLQRGSNGYITHYSGGGGVQLFPGGGVQLPISIETHITVTCDFPGGVWLEPIYPSGSAHFGTNRLKRACAASF